ncbi:hypothetical protein Y032_0173g388 [Ancylostoma ceylanicum]|uniref:Ion transport domain-containing protein n=1 Tax=Ancylostoma ceylanicum TaxID=53326 RepID=A0A016SV95_9BILA|nr:hypothetical protein Y032_0173g388 [Ancylostoma ceylanicum]
MSLQNFSSLAYLRITRPPWLVTVKWIVISLAIVQLIKELFQFITRRLRYITFDNGIECFVYSSAIVIVVDLSPCSHHTGLRMNWQWSLAAICAFSSWMNLLLLIRKLPKFGIYVVMFFDVLKTFSRFFLIFVLFIVAFSIAFYAVLQNRVDLVLQVEASMPPYIRKLTHRSQYVTLPNEKSFWKRLCNRFGFDSSSEEEVDSENKGEQEFISEFREELRSQNAQLQMLQSNVDNMYERQVRTEAMIRAVLKKLEIDFEEIDAGGK